MGWIAFVIILSIVAAGVSGFLAFATEGQESDSKPNFGAGFALGTAGWWVLFLIGTLIASVHAVPAGHVGVVYQFGAIVGQTDDGLQVIAPWRSLKQANVQVQRYTFEDDGEDKHEQLEAFSKETQDVFIRATINYQVSPDAIQTLYRNVGADWFDKLVKARVFQFTKDESVKYSSVDIAPHREDLRKSIRERLTIELAPYSVTVVDFLIDNLDFRPEFKTAIEQKQIASQDALREQERVKQREFEAEQVAATALGKANATRIEAQGQADANKLLSASLTPALIQFTAIQKLAGNIQIALIPSGQGVIIDPAALFGTAK